MNRPVAVMAARIMALALVCVMSAAVFTACSFDSTEIAEAAYEEVVTTSDGVAVSGKMYTYEDYRIFVPEGWSIYDEDYRADYSTVTVYSAASPDEMERTETTSFKVNYGNNYINSREGIMNAIGAQLYYFPDGYQGEDTEYGGLTFLNCTVVNKDVQFTYYHAIDDHANSVTFLVTNSDKNIDGQRAILESFVPLATTEKQVL